MMIGTKAELEKTQVVSVCLPKGIGYQAAIDRRGELFKALKTVLSEHGCTYEMRYGTDYGLHGSDENAVMYVSVVVPSSANLETRTALEQAMKVTEPSLIPEWGGVVAIPYTGVAHLD